MKILLVEDHPIVRAGCQRLLSARPGTELIEASTGEEALRLQTAHAPDLVVLDLSLPDMAGLEVLRRLRSWAPGLKVLVFTMFEDATIARHALSAGAAGYVTKNDDPGLLVEAVERIIQGEVFLGRRLAQELALQSLKPAHDGQGALLTQRETEALELLAQGKSLVEIAADLGISYRTSAAIAAALRSKLKLATMPALVKFAVESRGDPPTAPAVPRRIPATRE